MYKQIYGDKLNIYGTTRIYLRFSRGQAPKKVRSSTESNLHTNYFLVRSKQHKKYLKIVKQPSHKLFSCLKFLPQRDAACLPPDET